MPCIGGSCGRGAVHHARVVCEWSVRLRVCCRSTGGRDTATGWAMEQRNTAACAPLAPRHSVLAVPPLRTCCPKSPVLVQDRVRALHRDVLRLASTLHPPHKVVDFLVQVGGWCRIGRVCLF